MLYLSIVFEMHTFHGKTTKQYTQREKQNNRNCWSQLTIESRELQSEKQTQTELSGNVNA